MTNREKAAGGMSPDFAINSELLFADHKGNHKKGVEKRQRKLARNFHFLIRFLEQDERVICLATGCSPMGLWEQLITGSTIFYVKRALFAFTDRRIFHIPSTGSFKYRNSIAEIHYRDCESIKIRGHSLRLRYKSGKNETFHFISRSERKKIRRLLDHPEFDGMEDSTTTRTHLCPRCTKPLVKENWTCMNCRLEFKRRSDARSIALIFPGGGYFYTRHPFMGIADAFVELILLLLVFVAVADMVNGVPEASMGLFFVLVILGMEKAISVYHTNHFIREYLPKGKEVKPVEPSLVTA